MADPGLFFTVCTLSSIAMRLLAGPYFDRLPKEIVLCSALVGLAACMAGFASVAEPGRFLLLAGAYGLCLGAAMPLANAVMFGHSSPAMRGTDLNLMLFMMDAGYVFGPLAGGAILAAGAGYPTLFFSGCACMATAAGMILPLATRSRRERQRRA